jgi:hypothetical protein
MNQPSVLYQLIDSRLDGGLPALIERMRPSATWQEICDEIEAQTGLSVTRMTLRQWFANRITVEVKVA